MNEDCVPRLLTLSGPFSDDINAMAFDSVILRRFG